MFRLLLSHHQGDKFRGICTYMFIYIYIYIYGFVCVCVFLCVCVWHKGDTRNENRIVAGESECSNPKSYLPSTSRIQVLSVTA